MMCANEDMDNKGLRKIGDVELASPFILAPLAGVTDLTMRRICREMGAALTCTEMVSINGLKYGDKKTETLLAMEDNDGPKAVQLFGSDPGVLAAACMKIEHLSNDIVDLNLGCPVPKVVKNGDGSALLKRPHLVYDLIRAMVSSTDKPVTAKIRIGWDEESINAVEVAHAIESAGASAITVHGRTRKQMYSGTCNRAEIKKVKQAVSIPVIGNGDVFSAADALSMMEETGCDMVMIARGCVGNPWIFREALEMWHSGDVRSSVSGEECLEVMKRHLAGLAEEKGEYSAVREMRKFISRYIKGYRGAAAIRRKVNAINDYSELRKFLSDMELERNCAESSERNYAEANETN